MTLYTISYKGFSLTVTWLSKTRMHVLIPPVSFGKMISDFILYRFRINRSRDSLMKVHSNMTY